jgi:hypothetical protein
LEWYRSDGDIKTYITNKAKINVPIAENTLYECVVTLLNNKKALRRFQTNGTHGFVVPIIYASPKILSEQNTFDENVEQQKLNETISGIQTGYTASTEKLLNKTENQHNANTDQHSSKTDALKNFIDVTVTSLNDTHYSVKCSASKIYNLIFQLTET